MNIYVQKQGEGARQPVLLRLQIHIASKENNKYT